MTTDADSEIDQAVRRLGELPVAVPAFDVVRRRRERGRFLAVCTTSVLVVAGGYVVLMGGPGSQGRVSGDETPATIESVTAPSIQPSTTVVEGASPPPSSMFVSADVGSSVPTETTVPTTPDTVADPLTSATITTTTVVFEATTTLPTEPIEILAIGDSVIKGAAQFLTERGYVVIAEEGLQMNDAVPVLESLKANGQLDGTNAVVVHLGNNGPIESDTLTRLLAPLSAVPNVLLYTVHANRSWTNTNNEIIRRRDVAGDNIVLIDWDVRANECTNDCLYGDGIHLKPNGQEFYANLAQDWTGI